MKKFINRISLALAIIASVFVLSAPVVVNAADNYQAVCDGLALTGGDCATDPESQIDRVIKTALNLFSIVIGVVAVLMILVGGFKYVTSTGDSASINSAKNTILYAIIGLVIAASAQLIVQFVLRRSAPTTPTAPAPTTPAPGTPAPGTP